MKKTIFFSATLMLMTLFSSCEKEKTTPVDECTKECYNGGTINNNCNCECPTGFVGSNCQTTLDLQSMTINRIVINNYPHSTSSGTYWDAGSTSVKYPDLFLSENLGITANDIQWTPYLSNITASTVTFENFYGSGTFIYPTSTYNISLWDWDGGSDDFMAGIHFVPADYKHGYPPTIHLSGSTNQLDMTLYVTWNF